MLIRKSILNNYAYLKGTHSININDQFYGGVSHYSNKFEIIKVGAIGMILYIDHYRSHNKEMEIIYGENKIYLQ